MSLREVKEHLIKLEKIDLINHISSLYKNYPQIEQYFDFFIKRDENKLLDAYKKKIRKCLASRYNKNTISLDLNDIIGDFKKLKPTKRIMARLLLYCTECGIDITYEYGALQYQTYYDLADRYKTALDMINRENLLDKFEDDAYNMVVETEPIGGEFHKALYDTFYTYYN
jgi:hypothetical protein